MEEGDEREGVGPTVQLRAASHGEIEWGKHPSTICWQAAAAMIALPVPWHNLLQRCGGTSSPMSSNLSPSLIMFCRIPPFPGTKAYELMWEVKALFDPGEDHTG